MANINGEKTITFKIQRFDPARDDKPYFQNYQVPVPKGTTVLDAVTYIKEHLDGSLSYRCSCRMGVCGSCAMFVNGTPHLACHTQVAEFHADVLEIKSLPNFPIIKDLVPDLTLLFEKHKSVKPYILRADLEEVDNPTSEFLQTPSQLDSYIQFSYCLKCGCCIAACPTMATDVQFLGPQALGQAYRYNADNRDGGQQERNNIAGTTHGVWRCHLAGACAEACPKGVDPALAIQLLKRQMVFSKKQGPPAPPAGPTNYSRRADIPEAPARTVK